MQPELAQLRELSERRLGLVRDLTAELIGARPAITSMNVDAIYAHIARQTSLCRRLEDVRGNEASAWKQAASYLGFPANPGEGIAIIENLDADLGRRLRRIHTDLALAEGELRQQNRVHALLIDGTRRTLVILANALASLSPSYSIPAAPPPAALEVRS
ncbi:MAG TPA: hypothetical protein VMU61_09590 [Candidatus Aquilonibacter sp.]|nr:hypothetical protein [Candidatus Aquilonibacter sp.]